MSWAAIVGQPLPVRLLRQAVASGMVAHAYLFIGAEGVGKRTVALQLATALSCLAPVEGEACGQCLPCRRIPAGLETYPDIRCVAPEGRFVKTDQIRELQVDMYARPTEGRTKVAVVDGADRMNSESGNRILKLLEEPPDYAVLVLLAENLAGVLPTIVSRCQVINFPPLGLDEVATALGRQLGLDAGRARLYAALSGGSIGRAARLAADPAVMTRREDAWTLLRELPSMDDFALVGQAEGLEKQKEHLDEWLELLTTWIRDALLVAQSGAQPLVINADRLADVRSLAGRTDPAGLIHMLQAVAEARGQLQRYANARLVLDVLLLRLSSALRTT